MNKMKLNTLFCALAMLMAISPLAQAADGRLEFEGNISPVADVGECRFGGGSVGTALKSYDLSVLRTYTSGRILYNSSFQQIIHGRNCPPNAVTIQVQDPNNSFDPINKVWRDSSKQSVISTRYFAENTEGIRQYLEPSKTAALPIKITGTEQKNIWIGVEIIYLPELGRPEIHNQTETKMEWVVNIP